MTDAEWLEGWARLKLAYPERDEPEEQTEARATLYREALDDISGPAWLFAVTGAIQSETWFPTCAHLREHAAAYRPRAPHVAGLLCTATMSPEEIELEREERRQNARAGLEAIRRELAARGVDVEGDPAKAMPRASRERVVVVQAYRGGGPHGREAE